MNRAQTIGTGPANAIFTATRDMNNPNYPTPESPTPPPLSRYTDKKIAPAKRVTSHLDVCLCACARVMSVCVCVCVAIDAVANLIRIAVHPIRLRERARGGTNRFGHLHAQQFFTRPHVRQAYAGFFINARARTAGFESNSNLKWVRSCVYLISRAACAVKFIAQPPS